MAFRSRGKSSEALSTAIVEPMGGRRLEFAGGRAATFSRAVSRAMIVFPAMGDGRADGLLQTGDGCCRIRIDQAVAKFDFLGFKKNRTGAPKSSRNFAWSGLYERTSLAKYMASLALSGSAAPRTFFLRASKTTR